MRAHAIKLGKEVSSQYDFDEQEDLDGFVSDNDPNQITSVSLKFLTENEIIYSKSLLKVENEKWDDK